MLGHVRQHDEYSEQLVSFRNADTGGIKGNPPRCANLRGPPPNRGSTAAIWSVFAKSFTLNSSGGLHSLATAYDAQSPRLRAAG
jgi:hypothetical protein